MVPGFYEELQLQGQAGALGGDLVGSEWPTASPGVTLGQ